jgi:transcriptional regulator with XRE-family HTH domain
MLRKMQHQSSPSWRFPLTTPVVALVSVAFMARPSSIHKGRLPRRLHYIVEWAERRQVRQADIARNLNVDKSTVSRWFDGAIPAEIHLIALAGFLEAGEPAALFRHPDDDWMARFLRGRSADEVRRIRQLLEAAFPPKVA